MSKLTNDDPRHWHDKEGRHSMTDPRTLPGYRTSYYDDDEAAYVTHLEAHEVMEPLADDSEQIRALLMYLYNLEQLTCKLRELVRALRVKQRQQQND